MDQKSNKCDYSKAFELICLISSISSQMERNPSVWQIGQSSIYLDFEGSALDVEYISRYLAPAIININESYPLTFYGITERGKLAGVSFKKGKSAFDIELETKGIGGKSVDILSDFCIDVDVQKDEIGYLKNALQSLDWKKSWFVFDRNRFTESLVANAGGSTYYLYIPKDDNVSKNSFLEALDLPRMKELWLLFLRDGLASVEYDIALERWEKDKKALPSSFVLSLLLAMEECGITLEKGDNGYVFIENGKRRFFSFNSSNSTEKLMLSIMFPLSGDDNIFLNLEEGNGRG